MCGEPPQTQSLRRLLSSAQMTATAATAPKVINKKLLMLVTRDACTTTSVTTLTPLKN